LPVFPGISGASCDREYFGLGPIRCFVIEGHIRKVALAKSEMSPKLRDSHYNVSIAGQPHGKRQLVAVSKSDPGSPPRSSISPSPSSKPISISAKNQRLFASIIHRFHESIFEFDRRCRILSTWSSNDEISSQTLHRLPGRHLRTVFAAGAWRFFRLMLRKILKTSSSISFQLPVQLERRERWFEATVYPSSRSPKQSQSLVLRVQDITAQHIIEERLRDSEIMLEHAEEIAEMGTWEHDLKTGVIVWSHQLFKLHGLDSSQLPANADELWRILNFKNTEKLRKDFESAVRARCPFRFSEPYTLPDGSIRILDGLGMPVTDSTGKVARFVGITRDVTSQSRTQANLRWLSHQLLTIRTEEQRRMSRELHETTAQTLAALKMTLAQIGRSVPRHNDKVQKLVRTSATLASAAVREVRFVSSFLHPPMLEETGLVTALRSYGKLFTERGGVPVQVHIPNNFGRVEKELELTVFRIVQESLTNVHRHARATAAAVRIARSPGSLTVEIKDDGIGLFHVLPGTSAQIPLGVGIAGIRERVDQLQGQFDIISAPGAGTTIRALLPITSKESHHDLKNDAKRKRRAKTISDSRRRRSRHRSPGNSRASRN
jgi:PAS domain S-box-containing protein